MKKKIFDQKSKTVSQGHDDHKKFLSKPSRHFGEPTMYQQDSNPEGTSALQTFTTQSSSSHSRKPCKFFNASSHVMYRCEKYNSHEARRQRCLEMGLCVLCTSPFHKKQQCPGKINELKYQCLHYKVNSHISTLCKDIDKHKNAPSQINSNVCLNASEIVSAEHSIIMPIMDIKVKTGSKVCRARYLLDSGSQRSYLSEKVCAVLACKDENVSIIQHNIKTFLGSQKKELKEIPVAVEIPNLKPFNQKVLIDKEFHIQLNMPQYVEVISNLACKGVPLAVQYEGGLPPEIVEIEGLMGADVLQNVSMTRTVGCMKGIAWEFPNGLVPYGDANNFLFPRQISVLPSFSSSRPDTFNNYNHIISRYTKCRETHVNFVMNPKSSYPDPLQCLFPERNLDMMFQTEGLGIDSKENAITDYDSVKIKDFEDSIKFEDGHYNVKLPWHEDVLEKVPSTIM